MTVTFFWNMTPCNEVWQTDDQTIWRHNTEDQRLHIYRQENLRNHKLWSLFHVPMHAACLATLHFRCTVYDQKKNMMHSQYTWPWFDIINTACCVLSLFMVSCFLIISRSQLPRGLRRGSAAACLLWLWLRIPPGALSFVSCECCVLSGRGLCDGLITCPQEFYRVSCVQFVWSRSPVRGGHDRESDQSAKGIRRS